MDGSIVVSRLDLPAKIAGRAAYTADVELAGLCHAALVRSPVPRARIVEIDLAGAAGLPGVLAIFAAADLPARRYGRRVRDIPILADGEVRFAGERVVVVVAETREQAERAADLVRVEYEELAAVLTAEAAVASGAGLVHEAPWSLPGAVIQEGDGANLQSVTRHGDLAAAEAALEAAAYTIDRTYTTPSGHQGYLEPQACVASFDAATQVLHVWMANKSPYRLRGQLAECLELDPEAIVVHPVALGADFGGKGSPMDAPLCAELSRRIGRPVKLVQRYWEDLTAANPRHSTRVRIRIGCDAGGRLAGIVLQVLADGGAYAGFKPRPGVDLHGFEEAGTAYRLPAAHVEVRIAYTNTVPRGHMRSPGAPQAIFALESAIDELAEAAGRAPVELRRRNLLVTGEADWTGAVAVEARGRETLDAALDAYRPVPPPPGWLHGRGVGIYNRGSSAGRTSLRLVPLEAGIRAEVPMPENGAGSHQVIRNGLASLLGLEPSRVDVVQVTTADLPHDDGVGGSRVTGGLSYALVEVAEAFRRTGGKEPVTVLVDPGQVPSVTSYCVQIAQVAVDPESGQVRVLEVLTAADVARVLNPTAHRLQLEGAAAMGFGFACLEDLDISEGRVWAANLGEFKLPSARDVPAWRNVLVSGGKGIGGLGVKAIGELANVPTAAAIANAIAAASGARIRDLPVRAEKVHTQLFGGAQ